MKRAGEKAARRRRRRNERQRRAAKGLDLAGGDLVKVLKMVSVVKWRYSPDPSRYPIKHLCTLMLA